jgi:hypothetical protein
MDIAISVMSMLLTGVGVVIAFFQLQAQWRESTARKEVVAEARQQAPMLHQPTQISSQFSGFANQLQRRRLLTLAKSIVRAHEVKKGLVIVGGLLLVWGLIMLVMVPVAVMTDSAKPPVLGVLFGFVMSGVGLLMVRIQQWPVDKTLDALLREYPDILPFLGRKELLYDRAVAQELEALIEKGASTTNSG